MTKKIATTSKYQSEEEKRLARNKRVRERRKKQRAAKKATTAKVKSLSKPAVLKPVMIPQAAIVIATNDVSIYVDGEAHTSFTDAGDGSTKADFIDSLESLVRKLGAAVVIHDLRPAR